MAQRPGRNLIGWDEILEGGISKTATIMSWRGADGGVAAAKAGNQVIMTPNTHCYLDYFQTQEPERLEPLGIGGYVPVRKVYSFDPYDRLSSAEQSCIQEYKGIYGRNISLLLPMHSIWPCRGWPH